MAILRTDIARALDELINTEAGTSFQALAVVLSKQKWPQLVASEWHKDGGLDAYTPASVADGNKAIGVASSITGTLEKAKKDAKRAKDNYPGLEILSFVTPHKITALTAKDWADKIRDEFNLELIVVSREDIITSLMLPSNSVLCATLPGIGVPIEQDTAALLAKVQEAVAEVAQSWRARQRLANRPIVSLNAVKLDSSAKETSETLDPAREALLSFIDPQIPWVGVNIIFDYHNTERFASYIGQWARRDPTLKQRLISLSETSLTPVQRQLLTAIYHELGTDEAMLAGVNLLQSTIAPIRGEPGVEALFLERRPYGSSGYVYVPRNAARARAKLFGMVLDDPSRRKAALSILAQIEVWRIEHGRPPGEPRHPMIESGEPWPPLSFMK